MDSKKLTERLEKFPKLTERIEELLMIAENSEGEIALADEAEERIFQAGRALNYDALQVWAEQQSARMSRQFEQRHANANKDIKKNSSGIPGSER